LTTASTPATAATTTTTATTTAAAATHLMLDSLRATHTDGTRGRRRCGGRGLFGGGRLILGLLGRSRLLLLFLVCHKFALFSKS
jgi:hypothetical protein